MYSNMIYNFIVRVGVNLERALKRKETENSIQLVKCSRTTAYDLPVD